MVHALAGSDDAVVTGFTGTNHFGMIYTDDRYPSSGGMTGVTDISGINMSCRFTCRNHAIMTTLTGTHCLVMVNRSHRYPGR